MGSRSLTRLLAVGAAATLVLAVAADIGSARSAAVGARIELPRLVVLTSWQADTDNLEPVTGRLTLDGRPVAGARIRVDLFELPAPTDAQGRFAFLADVSRLAGHPVSVVDASEATVGSSSVDDAGRAALSSARGSINVAYRMSALRVTRARNGDPVITGKIARRDGTLPPSVSLYSYELTGTVVDNDGKPVVGARVSTRTADRDYWTISSFTDAHGRYTSLFTASSETRVDPVPFTVRVSHGDLSYEFLPDEFVAFKRLRSARLDIRLPPRRYALAIPLPESYSGAVYEGVLVGAVADGRPVKPVSATWLGVDGSFRLELPRALAGKVVELWQGKLRLFSTREARPGGPVELRDWPATLTPDIAQGLVRVRL